MIETKAVGHEHQTVHIAAADPSALGLFGLAMVTLVASSQKLEWTTGTPGIIPWAIFLGACAQLFACINDSKHKNTFGTTAFGAFGFFWLGVAFTWMIKLGVFGSAMADAFDPKQLGFAFLGYLIFSLFMTIGAMEANKTLFVIFILIDFLFLGLTLNAFDIMPELSHTLAAVAEFLIALASFYGSAAAVLNAHFGRAFLPQGKPFGIFKK